MKINLVLLLLLWGCSVWAVPQTKIACVGNSITYGSGIANRKQNSYPAQLQAMLGEAFEVRNFGVSGRTLLSKGDLPYIKTSEYQQVLAFQPDIVFIKLGTNDSKSHNRRYLSDFVGDYKALIESFRALSSHPRIILLTPVPAYTEPDTVNITTSVIRDRILPMVEQVAYETGLEIVHLYPLFSTYESHIMPDRIHPSSIGAGIIAKRLYEQVKVPVTEMDVVKRLEIKGTESNFYGYSCISFENQGIACKVVQPKIVAAGAPWIWRARFWGHEPQTDVALLDRGFHVVYCDVADLFGAPVAVKRWNHFYNRMKSGGLNPKVVLEGMSRGGLIIYNWAVANPDKVACVYADAPVLDLKSWPMGEGTKRLWEPEIKQMMQVYGFADRTAALAWRKNPIDQARRIAKAGFPMLHVCGDADDVVPVAENTLPFEQAILKNGGKIKVIRKPGVGHHPHSLPDPSEMVSFILKATGHAISFTAIPTPGNEFRSGAGWKDGSDWWANHKEISDILQTKQVDLLMIGNSITQGLRGSREIVTYNPGQEAMNRVFPGLVWESAGISGDRTENVLYRIVNGAYGTMKPKTVVLTIGINNLYAGGNDAEETAAGILACADALVEKLPGSEIVVCCTLPSGKESDGRVRQEIIRIDRILGERLKHKPVKYICLYDVFVGPDGHLREGCFGGDYLHLTPQGYEVWGKALAGKLSSYLPR